MKWQAWVNAINHVEIHPFPSPSFRTALSKPRNISYFPLKIRSRPKKGENRPRLWTERLDSWVSKIARLREDTTQKATRKKVCKCIDLLELRPSKNTVTPLPSMPIADVRYALESPWPCDELELGPSSRQRCLAGFFFAALSLGSESSKWPSLHRRASQSKPLALGFWHDC